MSDANKEVDVLAVLFGFRDKLVAVFGDLFRDTLKRLGTIGYDLQDLACFHILQRIQRVNNGVWSWFAANIENEVNVVFTHRFTPRLHRNA